MTNVENKEMVNVYETTKKKIRDFFEDVKEQENFTDLIDEEFKNDFLYFHQNFHGVLDMYATQKNGVIILSNFGQMYNDMINYHGILHQEYLNSKNPIN